jgi:micrococcal nuclease
MRCAASRAWRSGRLALLLLLLFSTTALVAQEKTSTLKVVGVHDGDSITCLNDDKRQLKVRLDAIDAPELGQPFGQASKKALSDMVFGKTVTVIEKKKDRWGRTVAHVLVEGKDTNLMMLEQGMAWHYTEYSNNKRLQKAEDHARSVRNGLWADRDPVPPWDWRKTERERKGKRQ